MGKKICSILSTLIMIVLLALAALLFVPRLAGCEEFAVLSGSMVPTIPVGALVVDKEAKPSELKEGDIITYRLSADTMVTHRIIAIDSDNQTVTTQGDANNVADANPVAFDNIIGVYAFHVPYLGFISIYGKTPLGIAAICGVLIVIILLNFLPDALTPEKKEEEAEVSASKGN
ncbi:MAG: signal peptidase I [Lachnospiraceae bacterium]|nr:signal peptidase I [Lachnospiraceae bacterium]